MRQRFALPVSAALSALRQNRLSKRVGVGRPRRRWRTWLLRSSVGAIALPLGLVLPWRVLPLPTSSFMLQNALSNRYPYRYTWVGYQQIAPTMALAVIAAEDQRFPEHRGFDWTEINAAIADHSTGADLRGASTLSQQVAKNLYLWPGGGFLRKGLEAGLTIMLETLWPKERILTVYLNIAQFGPQTFGVEAASQEFFGKAAADLSAEEAALLAAVLPGPELYSVAAPSDDVYDRQFWILQQMDQLGGTDYLQRMKPHPTKDSEGDALSPKP